MGYVFLGAFWGYLGQVHHIVVCVAILLKGSRTCAYYLVACSYSKGEGPAEHVRQQVVPSQASHFGSGGIWVCSGSYL